MTMWSGVELTKPCDEPHHAHQHDDKAHRKHHWKERLVCMSFCTVLHVLLELASHYGVWR